MLYPLNNDGQQYADLLFLKLDILVSFVSVEFWHQQVEEIVDVEDFDWLYFTGWCEKRSQNSIQMLLPRHANQKVDDFQQNNWRICLKLFSRLVKRRVKNLNNGMNPVQQHVGRIVFQHWHQIIPTEEP